MRDPACRRRAAEVTSNLPLFENQPTPAAGEMVDAFIGKLVEQTAARPPKSRVDHVAQPAMTGASAPCRRQALPEETVIQVCAAVVEQLLVHGLVALPDHFDQRELPSRSVSAKRLIQLGDVGLVMLCRDENRAFPPTCVGRSASLGRTAAQGSVKAMARTPADASGWAEPQRKRHFREAPPFVACHLAPAPPGS